MNHICFIHSSVEGQLGCFQFLAIMNKAAMNIDEQGGKDLGSCFLMSSARAPWSLVRQTVVEELGTERGLVCTVGSFLVSILVPLGPCWLHMPPTLRVGLSPRWLCLTDGLGDSQSKQADDQDQPSYVQTIDKK